MRNGVTVTDIAQAPGGLLAVRMESAGGTETVHARKLVLATGQDGAGRWWLPPLGRGAAGAAACA